MTASPARNGPNGCATEMLAELAGACLVGWLVSSRMGASRTGQGKMSKPQTSRRSHLALIASTVLATLAVQRHLSRLATPTATDDRQTLAPKHGKFHWRVGRTFLLAPFEWINEDRILVTEAGVLMARLRSSQPSRRWCRATHCTLTLPRSLAICKSLALMLPDGSFAVMQDQIGPVLGKATTLGTTFVLGPLIAIWSTNAGMKAIFDALNVVIE